MKNEQMFIIFKMLKTAFCTKKVALHNLGCKVNAYETEAMQELLENNGYYAVFIDYCVFL